MQSLESPTFWTDGVDGVDVPGYDRDGVTTGIVHFKSAGSTGRTWRCTSTLCWRPARVATGGICGVGVLDGDRRMQQVLDAQHGLYTLVRKEPDGTLSPRVVGSIVDYLFAPDDPEKVIEKIAYPATRIVSLTITEGGYAVDQVTGEFDPSEAGRRGAGAPPRAGRRPVDDHELRQHAGQRRHRPPRVHRLRRAA